MSDETSKAGPVLTESVEEVQAVFPSNAMLQDAIARLSSAGFDRADFSLPTTGPAAANATPEAGAADPITDTDVRQSRTMGASIAGSVGALAAAGATIATGGAAGVAIAAAAAVGLGAGLATEAVHTAGANATQMERDEAAARGELVLSVRAPTPEKRVLAEQIMRQAGASKAASVRRSGGAVAGIDSTGWTG